MIVSLISLMLFAQQTPLNCPAMGTPINGTPAEVFDFAGARFGTCCAGCEATFKKDPAKMLSQWGDKGTTIGTSFFDPVSGAKIDPKDAKGSSDFKGIRFFFSSDDNKKAFDADPKKFATTPAKEAMFCPVLKSDVKSYSTAGGFADYNGVRYYVCCTDCLAKLRADPAKFSANAAEHVQAPMVMDPPKG